MKNTLKVALFSVLSLLGVIILLGVVELGLVLAGYGQTFQAFQPVPGQPGFYRTNPQFADKYFSRPRDLGADAQLEVTDVFQMPKPQGVVRGIVIGESTAQGFPYFSNNSFSKMTQVAMNGNSKRQRFEILNLGLSAMSSYYVKDVASQLKQYDPDFVVIYSGHNEYYGTISYSTNKAGWAKDAYVWLKQYRLGQLVLGWLSPQNKGSSDESLMAQQFQGEHFPENAQVDQLVADEFVKNISAAVQTLTTQQVKVFVFTPVSNLVTMPPFAAAVTPNEKQLISDYTNDTSKSTANFEQMLSDSHSAYALYLKSVRELEAGKLAIEPYLRVKDQDEIPFRARSILVQSLQRWANVVQPNLPNFFFIDTVSEIQKFLGLQGFSDELFIDHVHFNNRGQQFLAKVLATALLKAYKFDFGSSQQVLGVFDRPNELNQAVLLNPAMELYASRSILHLADNLPFKGMLIPYQPLAALYSEKNNPLLASETYRRTLEQVPAPEIFNSYRSLLESESKLTELTDFYRSLLWISPGNATLYFAFGDFLSNNFPPSRQALDAYFLARAHNPREAKYEVGGRTVSVKLGLDYDREAKQAGFLFAK